MQRELVFIQRDSRTWEVREGNALKGILYHAFDGFELVVFRRQTLIYPVSKEGISDAQRNYPE
ncbi:MAG: hypothetical protein HC887_02050 [Desulfobacteraceae bacterium]|nr:hypothetical protein [Desulfobacteraceae bacterium]